MNLSNNRFVISVLLNAIFITLCSCLFNDLNLIIYLVTMFLVQNILINLFCKLDKNPLKHLNPDGDHMLILKGYFLTKMYNLGRYDYYSKIVDNKNVLFICRNYELIRKPDFKVYNDLLKDFKTGLLTKIFMGIIISLIIILHAIYWLTSFYFYYDNHSNVIIMRAFILLTTASLCQFIAIMQYSPIFVLLEKLVMAIKKYKVVLIVKNKITYYDDFCFTNVDLKSSKDVDKFYIDRFINYNKTIKGSTLKIKSTLEVASLSKPFLSQLLSNKIQNIVYVCDKNFTMNDYIWFAICYKNSKENNSNSTNDSDNDNNSLNIKNFLNLEVPENKSYKKDCHKFVKCININKLNKDAITFLNNKDFSMFHEGIKEFVQMCNATCQEIIKKNKLAKDEITNKIKSMNLLSDNQIDDMINDYASSDNNDNDNDIAKGIFNVLILWPNNN